MVNLRPNINPGSSLPGIYEFRLEALEPFNGRFTISNVCIEQGDAKMITDSKFEILK